MNANYDAYYSDLHRRAVCQLESRRRECEALDPAFAATLMVISTIVDIPATLINSTGNLTGTVLISRLSGK